MRAVVTVREHARLVHYGQGSTLDRAAITKGDFDWLCTVGRSGRDSSGPFCKIEDLHTLRLNSHVGVIEMPSGALLEILPKHYDDEVDPRHARALLCNMLKSALDLPSRDAGAADLATFEAPLTEWLFQHFLASLDRLVKRGLRFDYVRVEEEQRYMRGQLDIVKQMRQPPGRRHYLHTRHDVFSPNSSENRLLKSALRVAANTATTPSNWKLAHELLGLMAEIPESRHYQDDFQRWRTDRLMAHYVHVRPWCELILRQQVPLAVHDCWRGMSMLFPMERVFERFVGASLRLHARSGVKVTFQAASRFLATHRGREVFQLRPDFLLSSKEEKWVLDAKWKRIDEKDELNNYGLSQTDMYQLFAYGHKYLGGAGDMALLFPKTGRFNHALEPFHMPGGLRLWVLPFDLETATFLDLPLEWRSALTSEVVREM